ncbi:DUF1186 domain-containing protein [Bradyrhizobium iriomotense]|uniref:DUF1186 domain-containing protein n=1 Tax=Bradyrhizobium iriomotense TaxID=441950 RepID=UPI001FECDDF0|nr:DUF1186 domain-containing protein [Bradyrhizobium iriomotense]
MDAHEILERLSASEGLPTEAILAARANQEEMIPVFIKAFDHFVSSGPAPTDPGLFFAFHLLGEWRAKSAYRILAQFLRMPGNAVDRILGDAVTATTHRVMAAVFDGDPEPLREIVYTPAADEYIRSRMIEATALLTLSGLLPRTWTAQFLRECYDLIEPQADCYAWCGWQQSIAWLGLIDLKPLVQEAFARGLIDTTWLSFSDFEKDLRYAIDHPGEAPPHPGDKLTLFEDTIRELSTWAAFDPEYRARQKRLLTPSLSDARANPFAKVGRNDPCPCGSGKKFKKCCLNANLAS